MLDLCMFYYLCSILCSYLLFIVLITSWVVSSSDASLLFTVCNKHLIMPYFFIFIALIIIFSNVSYCHIFLFNDLCCPSIYALYDVSLYLCNMSCILYHKLCVGAHDTGIIAVMSCFEFALIFFFLFQTLCGNILKYSQW